jgi:hypothetical protein
LASIDIDYFLRDFFVEMVFNGGRGSQMGYNVGIICLCEGSDA